MEIARHANPRAQPLATAERRYRARLGENKKKKLIFLIAEAIKNGRRDILKGKKINKRYALL